MKKIISAVLCTALAAISILSVAGAEISDNSSTGISFDDFFYEYKIVGEDYIPDHYVRIYRNDSKTDPEAGITFIDSATEQKVTQLFDFIGTRDLYLPSTSEYSYEHVFHGGGSNGNFFPKFNKTGGTYQKIRVNLSKYSDYFDTHGNHNTTLGGEPHDYNFTKEYDGIHSSSLIVVSGGAVTAVVPDHNGMAEFYVSTNLGDTTFFTTAYRWENGLERAYGGGTVGRRFNGLTVGDTDKDGSVKIHDATVIQKYLAELETMSDIALRNADVNKDGKYDIEDVTAIQKFIAGM